MLSYSSLEIVANLISYVYIPFLKNIYYSYLLSSSNFLAITLNLRHFDFTSWFYFLPVIVTYDV